MIDALKRAIDLGLGNFSLLIVELPEFHRDGELRRMVDTGYSSRRYVFSDQLDVEFTLVEGTMSSPEEHTQDITIIQGIHPNLWEMFAKRLNERRNSFTGIFKHPVLMVGGSGLNDVLRDEAPDLWSIRSGVFTF